MSRPKNPTLTDGELRLMHVLWDKGEATVGEVLASLNEPRKPAYNTVLTLLRILERKGYLTHRKAGRAFTFLPVVDRAHARQSALRTLVNRFFEGSPRLLVLNLMEGGELSEAAIEQLARKIEDMP